MLLSAAGFVVGAAAGAGSLPAAVVSAAGSSEAGSRAKSVPEPRRPRTRHAPGDGARARGEPLPTTTRASASTSITLIVRGGRGSSGAGLLLIAEYRARVGRDVCAGGTALARRRANAPPAVLSARERPQADRPSRGGACRRVCRRRSEQPAGPCLRLLTSCPATARRRRLPSARSWTSPDHGHPSWSSPRRAAASRRVILLQRHPRPIPPFAGTTV